ncbi:MAG: trigger factor [Puniceicoccales bacterium]|nr:trigger factor [Puniceicoccales bacterium]
MLSRKLLTKMSHYLVLGGSESCNRIVKESIVNIGDTRVSAVYTFDSSEIEAERESVIAEFCSGANIAGFRKGKVPRNVILMKFADSIKKQLESNVTNKAIDALSSWHPEWVIISLESANCEDTGGEMVCSLVANIVPEFEMPDYGSISITPINVSVSEEEIGKEVRNLLKQHAEYRAVNCDAKVGDFVKLDYVGKFEDGSEVTADRTIPLIYGSHSTWEEAGNANAPIEAVANGVIGMKAGDKKSVSQKFADDINVPGIAGKIINYDLEVLEVRECVMPELTEDLLEKLSVKTEDGICSKVRNSISERKISQARIDQRTELVTKLCEMSNVKVPDVAINGELLRLIGDFGGVSAHRESLSREDLNSIRTVAEKRIRLGIVLDKIAANEHVELVSGDVENMIWKDVHANRINPNQYVNELRKDRNRIVDVRRRALHGKTLDHLMYKLCKDFAMEIQADSRVEGTGELSVDGDVAHAHRETLLAVDATQTAGDGPQRRHATPKESVSTPGRSVKSGASGASGRGPVGPAVSAHMRIPRAKSK